MSKEIDNIKKCIVAGYDIHIINQQEMNNLWNYITNLQEEYNDLLEVHKIEDNNIQDLQEENKKLKDRIHALEEHNKHLNKEAQKYFSMYMDREYSVKDTYDTANDVAWELFKEKEELEERIDKTIEFVEALKDKMYFDPEDLLKILKGDE